MKKIRYFASSLQAKQKSFDVQEHQLTAFKMLTTITVI